MAHKVRGRRSEGDGSGEDESGESDSRQTGGKEERGNGGQPSVSRIDRAHPLLLLCLPLRLLPPPSVPSRAENGAHLVTEGVLDLEDLETVFFTRAAKRNVTQTQGTKGQLGRPRAWNRRSEGIKDGEGDSQMASFRLAMVRNSLMSLISLGCEGRRGKGSGRV